MNWTLEVVMVPVSDVDRSKAFYAEKLGFDVDHDTKISEEYRVVQLTPPGSGCSIVVGKGVVDTTPGSLKGLQLAVKDIRAAQAWLVEGGGGVGGRGGGGGAGGAARRLAQGLAAGGQGHPCGADLASRARGGGRRGPGARRLGTAPGPGPAGPRQ